MKLDELVEKCVHIEFKEGEPLEGLLVSASVNLQSSSIEKVSSSSQDVAALAETLNAEITRFTIA